MNRSLTNAQARDLAEELRGEVIAADHEGRYDDMREIDAVREDLNERIVASEGDDVSLGDYETSFLPEVADNRGY